jgi:hypothetical protein
LPSPWHGVPKLPWRAPNNPELALQIGRKSRKQSIVTTQHTGCFGLNLEAVWDSLSEQLQEKQVRESGEREVFLDLTNILR